MCWEWLGELIDGLKDGLQAALKDQCSSLLTWCGCEFGDPTVEGR